MSETKLMDAIVAGQTYDVLGETIAAIEAHDAAAEPKPTLAEHLGMTEAEYQQWGGPGTRTVNGRERTTVGDAMAFQDVIQARIKKL